MENRRQPQADWAFYVAQDYRLNEIQFRRDAQNIARTIMQSARRNIELVISRLKSRGYEFIEPDRVHILPEPDVADWAAKFESQGIYLPIALQAWLQEVGTVNLMGTDKSWPCSGYSGFGQKEVWYADPLVVEVDKDLIYSEFENWKSQCEEEGIQEAGPFCIPFAPDDLHKANISGGLPYELCAAHPVLDPIVLNERHCFSFVAHIRHAFSWAGFPGFEIIGSNRIPIDFLNEIRNGLEPL
jgi:hypothetical protein